MESKITIIFLFITIFSSCKAQEFKAIEQSSDELYSKQEIIADRKNSKKYALCSCLKSQNFIYNDSTKIDHSTNVYKERGIKSIEFYRELSNFVKKEIKKMGYKSHEGDKVVLKMSECIDFYESKELEEYIMSIENKNYND